jgi:hypothetical protein
LTARLSAEPGLDVDVRVELVDERGRDLLPDRGIGDHLLGRVADRRCVERLVADVARDQSEHRDDEREENEDPGRDHPAARSPFGGALHSASILPA